jgi:hypothetical protein
LKAPYLYRIHRGFPILFPSIFSSFSSMYENRFFIGLIIMIPHGFKPPLIDDFPSYKLPTDPEDAIWAPGRRRVSCLTLTGLRRLFHGESAWRCVGVPSFFQKMWIIGI